MQCHVQQVDSGVAHFPVPTDGTLYGGHRFQRGRCDRRSPVHHPSENDCSACDRAMKFGVLGAFWASSLLSRCEGSTAFGARDSLPKLHSIVRFSAFPTTWVICSSLDGQPNGRFRWLFDTVLIRSTSRRTPPAGAAVDDLRCVRRDNGRGLICPKSIYEASVHHLCSRTPCQADRGGEDARRPDG
jgi:hypothetical protein